MNIICITTGMRPELLVQSLESLANNAANWDAHHLTLVIDGHEHWKAGKSINAELPGNVLINTSENVGASAARNIGAGSVPKYRRQEHVMFVDDDVYCCRDWDKSLLNAALALHEKFLVSPYGHPFNIEDERRPIDFAKFPLLISSVAAFMSWRAFDEIGYWLEPGGASGSEDFEFCSRARDNGYDFAVLNPHACIHTGMTSSNGKQIVGYKELGEQNQRLLDYYGLNGKVVFS